MGHRNELVGLLLEGFLNLGKRGAVSDGGLDLGNIGAVGLQACGIGISKVAGVKNEGILTLLDQVRGDHIPAKGATSGHDEGLSGGVGGLEELPDHSQGLTKGLDEAGASMALADQEQIQLVHHCTIIT